MLEEHQIANNCESCDQENKTQTHTHVILRLPYKKPPIVKGDLFSLRKGGAGAKFFSTFKKEVLIVTKVFTGSNHLILRQTHSNKVLKP